jgi:general secretion pathway protein K
MSTGRKRVRKTRRRGSALLAVLWVSAALAAIAFSLSNTVLGETERTSTDVDGLRAYYLAEGAIERAQYEMFWNQQDPNKYRVGLGSTAVDYDFPSGIVHVELIPETAKLNINTVAAQELYRLVQAMGLEPARATEITAAILDWREGQPGSSFDQYYASFTPSFRARHASFEEIEELLSVKGITPDLFYGTYLPSPADALAAGPRLQRRPGLVDCLSVFGSQDQVDVNTAPAPVLAAIGLSPDAINLLLQRRRVGLLGYQELAAFSEVAGSAAARLRVGGISMLTARATARLRLQNGQLSDLRRTVAALLAFRNRANEPPFHVLRWYDTAWSN